MPALTSEPCRICSPAATLLLLLLWLPPRTTYGPCCWPWPLMLPRPVLPGPSPAPFGPAEARPASESYPLGDTCSAPRVRLRKKSSRKEVCFDCRQGFPFLHLHLNGGVPNWCSNCQPLPHAANPHLGVSVAPPPAAQPSPLPPPPSGPSTSDLRSAMSSAVFWSTRSSSFLPEGGGKQFIKRL